VYAFNETVGLFNVDGTVYAISNRCTHARASLSEGTVDPAACTVTCPWHEGRFSLVTGAVLSGPPVQGVRAYQVKIEGDTILVAPAPTAASTSTTHAGAREPTVAR
jgi:nitrite reductase/ring-hydroxylating ferredoxin subunit